MKTETLFTKFPEMTEKVPFVSLIKEPTGVHSLERIGLKYGHQELYIKREDQTHKVYGGNKVRNLEFVLGDAIRKEAKEVITLVPYGSNFTAALSAQAKELNLKVTLSQFIAKRNPQIEAHAKFSSSQGALLHNFKGSLGPLAAFSYMGGRLINSSLKKQKVYYISPGASSLYGALGHTNAFLEFASQVKNGDIPKPDYLIVGVGTCGTFSGLLAGNILSGLNIKLIGVRCAEPIVCNPQRIKKLTNKVLEYLGASRVATNSDFELRDLKNNNYAVPNKSAFEVIDDFYSSEEVLLDTTYTSKVGVFLKNSFKNNEFRGKRVLYWHTFSPNALNLTEN
jgi:1-aminocyclopropane-1-carboxylate deaminase/D-cysteine desulfhydrase-like pyridoxal-dependent ACC family enzyme